MLRNFCVTIYFHRIKRINYTNVVCFQSDFGTYVTPVVSIPEQPPDEVDSVASLIDTSDTMSQVQPKL